MTLNFSWSWIQWKKTSLGEGPNHWVPSRGRSESAALGVCVHIKTHTLRVLPIHFGRETVPSVQNRHNARYSRSTLIFRGIHHHPHLEQTSQYT